MLTLLPVLVSAQLAKGFQLLEASDYEQAIPVFEALVGDPVEGVAAKFGLASCYYKQTQSVDAYLKGFDLLRVSEAQYRKLSQSDKSKISKYKVSLSSYSRLEEEIQMLALKIVSDQNSVLQLDEIMDKMRPFSSNAQKRLDESRAKIVNYAAEYASDYATLSSLVKKHYMLIATTNYKNEQTLLQRLRPAFVKDSGEARLNSFVREHPKNAFSKDCWVHQYIDGVNPKVSVKKLLRFLCDYPYSTIDIFAESRISRWTYKGTVVDNNLNLDQREKNQLDILKKGWQLDEIIKNDKRVFDEAAKQILFEYIPQKRATRRGYELMQDALEKCLKDRQWAIATAIVDFSQPYFQDFQPDSCKVNFNQYSSKQDWFGKVKPIVNLPEEGLYRKALSTINTDAGAEYSPTPSADGRSLYFAGKGRKDNIGGEDIFVSHYNFETKMWSAPEIVTSLSSSKDDVPVAITFDGTEMVLFRDGKLYTSNLTEQGWGTPVLMPGSINRFPWIGKATYSSDGNVLIFEASEQLTGLDDESNIDLYVSRRESNGGWSTPKSLGPDINTFDDERTPFLYPDNKTLYFSSNGRSGLGEKDIYFSKRLDDTWMNWSVPKNLGKEINSMGEDWDFKVSLNPAAWEAYFSKANPRTLRDDIYVVQMPSFARPPRVTPLNGKLDNVDPKTIGGAKIVITNADDNTVLDTIRVGPGPEHVFTLPIRSGVKRVEYHVIGKDIIPQSRIIDVSQLSSDLGYTATVPVYTMSDMEKGIPVSLNSINFDYDKSDLRPESFPELERIYLVLKDKGWRIEIAGHTDDVGSADYNLSLSHRRAEAVKTFLVQKGLPSERLTTRGYGAQKPVAENSTDAGRMKNRRVEVTIQK